MPATAAPAIPTPRLTAPAVLGEVVVATPRVDRVVTPLLTPTAIVSVVGIVIVEPPDVVVVSEKVVVIEDVHVNPFELVVVVLVVVVPVPVVVGVVVAEPHPSQGMPSHSVRVMVMTLSVLLE
jgi:hypothetical protein